MPKIIHQGKGFFITEDGHTHIENSPAEPAQKAVLGNDVRIFFNGAEWPQVEDADIEFVSDEPGQAAFEFPDHPVFPFPSLFAELPFKPALGGSLIFNRDVGATPQSWLFNGPANLAPEGRSVPIWRSDDDYADASPFAINTPAPVEVPSVAEAMGAFLGALMGIKGGLAESLELFPQEDDVQTEANIATEDDEDEFLDVIDELLELVDRLDELADSPFLTDTARENASFLATVIHNGFHAIQECD